jgi:hypothetical protein
MNAERAYAIAVREETTPIVGGAALTRFRVIEVLTRGNRISRRTLSLHDALHWAIAAAERKSDEMALRRGTAVPVLVESPKTWPPRLIDIDDVDARLPDLSKPPVVVGEA